MSNRHGKEGVVKIGANSVLSVTRWSLKETVDIADATAMGDAAKSHLPGIPAWSASITARMNKSDTTGQNAMTIGASVVASLYDDGTGSGQSYHSGTATVSDIDRTVDMGSVIEYTFALTGNGALTHPTI